MCVISEDVNSFGDGDVVKVLTIDLHDLREDGIIEKKPQKTNIDEQSDHITIETSVEVIKEL